MDKSLNTLTVFCSPSMKALFMCLKRRSDDCSISPYDELAEFYVEFHQDLKYQFGPKINTGDWEEIYSWFMKECPGIVGFIWFDRTEPKCLHLLLSKWFNMLVNSVEKPEGSGRG